ncbi:MAG TPA: phosphatase PAP2 family protein [Polyangiaceae bacterium]|nr:phosphatase PAP2 family protein [Polyangiaceae bacterium]
MPSESETIERRTEPWWLRTLRETAVHDFAVFLFLLCLNGFVLATPSSSERSFCLLRTGSLLLVNVLSLVLVRGRLLKRAWVAAVIYRIGIYGVVQVSYFFLRHVLPLVNPTTLDQKLYEFDLWLFHYEPAMAWDRFVTPATTEWFSFFYFGYFLLMAVHVVPLVFFGRKKQIVGEFTFGILLMFSIGHTLYMVVPGYGPYRAMADAFHHPFPDGPWYDLVMDTVHSGGAMMDIFPSLHTGAPTVLALFSYRNRHELPYRYTWPIVTFCTVNIIIATMFLRWHYLIDVVAGFSIAVSAVLLSRPIVRWELARRSRQGLGELWPEFSNAPLTGSGSGSGSKDLADGAAVA